MVELEVVNSKPLTLADLNSRVKSSKKKEIPSVQQKVLEHSAEFSKLNKSKELKLVKELNELDIPRMSDEHIATIVNLMPRSEGELKTVFMGTKTTIASENLEKIQKLLKKYGK